MKNLIKDKIGLLIVYGFIFLTTGCQTFKDFSIESDRLNELNVITITPERIIQNCTFLNASDENKWRHQYRLHVLNSENEVISIYHPVNQDLDTCNIQLKKIQNVLKKSKKIKICARDVLEKNMRSDRIPELHDFGTLGKHKTPYEGLIFDTICNENNKCFSISDTWTYTCPKLN